MAARTVRLIGGPCDGLTRTAPAGDWESATGCAIAVLDQDARCEHIYDLATEPAHSPGPDVLVFRYRGTLVQAGRADSSA